MSMELEGEREMKRILHMTPMDVHSGVYKYVFQNMEYINQDKYEFGFLTRAAELLYKSDEYKKFQFHIHPFFSTQRSDAKGLEDEVRNVLQEYDIIHLHTSSWRGFLIEQLAMNIGLEKVIVHSHSTGIDISDENEREKQIKEHILYREKFNMKYATDFCACSKMAAEWLFGNSIPREMIRYMPNAIDTHRFQYNEFIRNNIRATLNVMDKFVIGHVGRYSYTKNLSFLFRCLAEIKKLYNDIVLVCIGEGELKSEYEKTIKQFGIGENVILLEWQENIEDFYQAFDLFCLPSIFEGFPISVVEAQSTGLPCLVSDKVTDEVKLTSLVEFCILEEQRWIDSILHIYHRRIEHRYGFSEKVSRKGYDIRESARLLEELYDE